MLQGDIRAGARVWRAIILAAKGLEAFALVSAAPPHTAQAQAWYGQVLSTASSRECKNSDFEHAKANYL